MFNNNLYTLAAYAGISNIGMVPSARNIQYSDKHSFSLDHAVVQLGQEFMESDEDYDNFLQEARSWLETYNNMNDEEILKDRIYLEMKGKMP